MTTPGWPTGTSPSTKRRRRSRWRKAPVSGSHAAQHAWMEVRHASKLAALAARHAWDRAQLDRRHATELINQERRHVGINQERRHVGEDRATEA